MDWPRQFSHRLDIGLVDAKSLRPEGITFRSSSARPAWASRMRTHIWHCPAARVRSEVYWWGFSCLAADMGISDFVWLGGLRSLWTYCLLRSLRQGKCVDRALVLVGSTRQARHLSDDIERESRGQIAVISVMGIPGTPGGVPIDRLDEVVRAGMVDRVIIANFEGAIEQSRALLARLMRVAVDVTVIPISLRCRYRY